MYVLSEEQREIIKQEIRHFIHSNGRILQFLRERELVDNLEEEIIYDFGQELEHGKIGIKSQRVSSSDYNMDYIAVIKITLKINIRFIENWISNGRKLEDIVFHPHIFKKLVNFYQQLEKFILRGMDIIDSFDLKNLEGTETFDSFFCSPKETASINLNKFGDLYGAVGEMEIKLRREGFNPPFILLSDSATHMRAEMFHAISNVMKSERQTIIDGKENIDDWIDLIYNADDLEKIDHKLVCIPKFKQIKPTFRLIEKSYLEISFRNNGGLDGGLNYNIDVYWCGALEISDKNAVQCIKIRF